MKTPKKFCPKCGREETPKRAMIEGLCGECFLSNFKLLKDYKSLKVILCQRCNSYLNANQWYEELDDNEINNLRKVIQNLLPEKLVYDKNSKIKTLKILPTITDTNGKKTIQTEIFLTGDVKGQVVRERKVLEVLKDDTLCNNCKKKGSSYYEAIIQLRPKNKKLINFIKSDIEEERNVHITKQEVTKFGVDFYITSRKYLFPIIQKVKKKFSVETKTSKTLFGKKDGKEIYRITALIRLKE